MTPAKEIENLIADLSGIGHDNGSRFAALTTRPKEPVLSKRLNSGYVPGSAISSFQREKQAPALAENSLTIHRFRQAVNKQPWKTLDTLFFDCYQAMPGLVRFSQLHDLLVPHSSYIYPGIALYAEHLQASPVIQTGDQRGLIRREARYLCREIVMLAMNDAAIPLSERKKLHQALHWLKVTPEAPADISTTLKETLANIDLYLDKADLLAELPQFQPVYFTSDELAGFHRLQILRSSPELESQLEIALAPLRKREILQLILNFIRLCPLPFLRNQAIAVYITLGEVIPWHQHAFIKRLLAVSVQESIVYNYLA